MTELEHNAAKHSKDDAGHRWILLALVLIVVGMGYYVWRSETQIGELRTTGIVLGDQVRDLGGKPKVPPPDVDTVPVPVPGPPGTKGDTGDKGELGDRGATGKTGSRGRTGFPGAKGDTGDAGAAGQPGESVQGPPGESITGPQGEQGPAGEQGVQGPGIADVRLEFREPDCYLVVVFEPRQDGTQRPDVELQVPLDLCLTPNRPGGG